MKRNSRKVIDRRRPESKPAVAPRPSNKPPWTTRQLLGVYSLVLGGLLLGWFLPFPDEFGYAVSVVRGWFTSAPAPAAEEVGTAEINQTPAPGSAPEGMVWI